MKLSLTVPRLPDLERLAGALASAISGPQRIYLHGHIGAGKTTLVGAILHAWGHPGTAKSPTFTFVEPYELARGAVYHLDLYRLERPEELEFLGVGDYLEGEGVCFVEWPVRAAAALPAPDIDVFVEAVDDARVFVMVSVTDRGEAVLGKVQQLLGEGCA